MLSFSVLASKKTNTLKQKNIDKLLFALLNNKTLKNIDMTVFFRVFYIANIKKKIEENCPIRIFSST